MAYVIVFCIGVFFGVVVSTFMIVSGNRSSEEDAYNRGVEYGKSIKDE